MTNRELDAWIAEHVTKRKRAHEIVECDDCFYNYCSICYRDNSDFALEKSECSADPPYSSDMKAAMEVEDAMSKRGWYLELFRIDGGWRANFRKWLPVGSPDGAWFSVTDFGQSDNPDTDPDRSGHKYAPMAICLAAKGALVKS